MAKSNKLIDLAQELAVHSIGVMQEPVVCSIDVAQEPAVRSVDITQKPLVTSIDIAQEPATLSIDAAQDSAARSTNAVRSSARAGFKRELAFALKAQSELNPTLGPTRLRKPPIPFCLTSIPSSSILGKSSKNVESSNVPRKRGKQVKAPAGDPSSLQSSLRASVSLMETLAISDGHGGPNVEILIDVDGMTPTLKHASWFTRPESSCEIKNMVGGTLVPVPIMHAEFPREIAIIGNVTNAMDLLAIGKEKEVETHGLIKDADKCEDSFHASNAEEFTSLGDLSQESKQYQMTPAQSHASSGAGLSKQTIGLESSQCASQEETVSGKLTNKDLGLHKLIFESGRYENIPVVYRINKEKTIDGWIENFGIHCDHCHRVVSASQFEAHAGCAHRRKPYHNTYTYYGKSLHQIALELSAARNKQSDTLCQMCKTSGILVECDRCPRAYHKECAGLSSIPESWLCPFCCKMYKREKPRRVQMIKTSKTKLSSCVLCRSTDFLKSGFGPRTVMLCDQCDKEYHIGCLKDNNMCDLKELPNGDWFCSNDCKRINTALKELDLHEPEPLPDLVSDLIKNKCEEKGLHMDANTDLRWKLIQGKSSAAKKSILSRIVSMFHESFKPIKDDATGGDLIKAMVYGRKIGSHDFHGMQCAVLTVNSFVVSAALLRVLGCEAVEMPLAATYKQDQGMGYFRSLFWCILRMLSNLGVKHFVLPAAKDAESYWRNMFGFEKLSREKQLKCAKDLYLTVFEGTSLLYKPIPAPQAFAEGSRTHSSA